MRKAKMVTLNILAAGCILLGGIVFSGCGKKGSNTEPVRVQWSAPYAFDKVVTPYRGESGVVKTFTFQENIDNNGTILGLRINGTYLGKENTKIETRRIETNITQSSEYSETNVTMAVECCKLEQNIAVLRNDAGGSYPDWANVTIWIPAAEFRTSNTTFGICAKAEYLDSQGDTGFWSYFVTQAMQNEVDNPPQGKSVSYLPCEDGEFCKFDENALYGLYGLAWQTFQPFAEGGNSYLENKKWSEEIKGVTFGYDCFSVTRSIGNCDFEAWELSLTFAYGGEEGEFDISLCPDLPIPFHFETLSRSEGGNSSMDYILTDLKLG